MDTTSDSPGAPRFQNRTLREQVLDHLREEILSSRLAPGSELNEVGLAESLGISRGPLREALGRLAAEGLVTMIPRRGAVVTKLTQREFVDAYQVRAALESLAIRLAVPRLTDDERARLHELAETMVAHAERDDVPAFFETNREFHRMFVVGSGNERLRAMHEQLINQMGRLLARSLQLRGSMQQSIDQHRAILEAVDAGDAARAAELLEAHVETPAQLLEGAELFESQEEGA